MILQSGIYNIFIPTVKSALALLLLFYTIMTSREKIGVTQCDNETVDCTMM